MTYIEAFAQTKLFLPIGLLRAREALMRHYRAVLAPFDLTEQQWRVLRALKEKSPQEASELAAQSFILAPSLTRIIRCLEERGLITKDKDPKDGRCLLIKLSPSGLVILNNIECYFQQIDESFFMQFGSDKLKELAFLLNKVEQFQFNSIEKFNIEEQA